MSDTDFIRPYPVSSLRASIDAALAGVPPGVGSAVIARADMDGARLEVFGRIGDRFSYMGVLDKRYSGPLTAEVALVWYPGFGGR